MKKVFVFLLVVGIAVSAAAYNCNNNVTEDSVTSQRPKENMSLEATPEVAPSPTIETESTQEAVGGTNEQKVIEYLGILGFDEGSDYIILDWFAIKGSDEKSVLLDINNVSQEQFDEARFIMEGKGCYLVSDIMMDEEKKTTSYQYRNSDDTLYIEMVYSAEANYINIIFTPIH